MSSTNRDGLRWWESLRHGGMLLDARRLAELVPEEPPPLLGFQERKLRRQVTALLDERLPAGDFVAYVLEEVCGLDHATGTWRRGSDVPAEWTRTALTGEAVRPRQLWQGTRGGVLPVFLDQEKRLGVGRGRRISSQVLQWLRQGEERLALVTNARQWRLIFAGLDYDAWCEWDVEQWLEEGGCTAQVSGLRSLFAPALWAAPSGGEPRAPRPPSHLLAAILESRKGQSELSQILGERVRQAVELIVAAHGEALHERAADERPADIYRAAVRLVMRMVVVLFAEARELLPRGSTVYHGAYGLQGLREQLDRAASRSGGRLAQAHSAWPRVLSLFRLIHEGSHHEALQVPRYGGELFAPGDVRSSDGVQRALHLLETACYERTIMSDRDVRQVLDLLTRTRVKVRRGRTAMHVSAPVDFSDLSTEYIGILYEGLLDFELRAAPTGDPIIFVNVGDQPALPLSRLEQMDDRALAALFEKLKERRDPAAETGGDQEQADADETTPEAEADEPGADESPDAESPDAESPDTESGDAEPGDAAVDEGDDEAQASDDSDGLSGEAGADTRHVTRTRAESWARRAAEAAKLVSRPRGSLTPQMRHQYEAALAQKAHQLVSRVVLPGEWYLVRWGGTRKGSGTFYTRPQLAVPTVQRTLRPLAYEPPLDERSVPDLDAPAARWLPRKPEAILALKVCDPACGSGSFPVAALRFLTEALYTSLHHHGRIREQADQALIALLTGAEGSELLAQERIPCRPDDEHFEPRLKAVLKRHVVERSIYGVDLDPLAVELCRLSLWIETMDRELPFSFLDHKIRPGNSLVGCWFDRFQHYPVMAWERDGGDAGHSGGVHFARGERTKAIKAFKTKRVKPDLAAAIEGPGLFDQGRQERAERVHDEAVATLGELHDLPVVDHADRSRIYRERFLGSPAWRSLKDAFDLWCALWFWPPEELGAAPLPTSFASPPARAVELARGIAGELRFFHWELEFPDVFAGPESGFDAIVGNPPWDIAKPSSKEFFSSVDPLYRTYGKQEAIAKQKDYFAAEVIERGWLDHCAGFRAQSNLVKHAAFPFGDAKEGGDAFSIARGNANRDLHGAWRVARRRSGGYADARHAFRHQGSADINLYKMFIEQAHALLRVDGRFGLICPSGLYSDHGTGALRELLLDQCRWEWLFGFENREGIFDIHRSFKFNPVIVAKGGRTDAIRTAFMRRSLDDWANAEAHATPYARSRVTRFSPRSKAILEIQSQRDLEILEKIYANSVLLGDDGPDGWGIKYATEFHMTNDSKLFPPRPWWEAKGYKPDEYSRWLKGDWQPIGALWAELGVKPLREGDRRCAQPPYDTLPIPRADIPVGVILSRDATEWVREGVVEDVALPLYQGRMIWQFDSSAACLAASGDAWSEHSPHNTYVGGQYLIGRAETDGRSATHQLRLAFRDIQNATNQRTFIGCVLPPFPAVNTVPVLTTSHQVDLLSLLASATSFAADRALRLKMSQNHVNWFYAQEIPVVAPAAADAAIALHDCACALAIGDRLFAARWLTGVASPRVSWRKYWARTPAARMRLRAAIDAMIATVLGLDASDLLWLLKDCDWPAAVACHPTRAAAFDPKGFWRVDKAKDPELRHTVLTLAAFRDLQDTIARCGGDREKGIEAFCNQNDGEGWMLPEELCLADLGLGHDDRAKVPQPVASRLGPRFYDWQLAQTPEESWRECELHARNLLGEEGYRQLCSTAEMPRDRARTRPQQQVEPPRRRAPQGSLFDG